MGAIFAGMAAFAAGAVGFGGLLALALAASATHRTGNPWDDLHFMLYLAAWHGAGATAGFGFVAAASGRWRQLSPGRAAFLGAVAGIGAYGLQWTGLALLFVSPALMLLRPASKVSMALVMVAPGLVAGAACLLFLAGRRSFTGAR